MEGVYEIKPIILSRIWRDSGIMHYLTSYGQKRWYPVTMWYIKGAEVPILVDTGGSARDFYRYNPMPAEDIMTFDKALMDEGLQPSDIGMIICTHLHYDHVLNAGKCKNARIVVQKKELEFACSPHPFCEHMYDREMVKDLTFETVDGDVEIMPGLQLYHFGGHTAGTQGVGVRTAQGLSVISGMCCDYENFYPPPGLSKTPVLAPGVHVNSLDAYDSILRIKDIADVIFPNHDTRLLEASG
jgi:glyoxylase-like metal-dependent hydrolase (beta-lactamase superfamily II)